VTVRLPSLSARLAVLTGAWVALGLVVFWLWVTGIVSQAAERSFNARLVSQVDGLVAAVGLKDGQPYLIRQVSEPRFDRPLSGVYYQIEGPGGAVIASRSLGDQQLPPGTTGHSGILWADIPGPRGQHLRMAERDIVPLDGQGTMHIIVAADLDETMTDVLHMRRILGIGFVVLGGGLVGAVVLQVSLGLSGLRRLRGAVAELRAGGQVSDLPTLPSEVRPLVQEIDALVRQNRATVERARNHIGNLAHALRTRLSIMRNALDTGNTALVGGQLTDADRLVQHHLARARAASLSGTAAVDVSVADIAQDLSHALHILFVDRDLTIQVIGDPAIQVRCEREDLAEILGNLMENACKWATSRVRVTVRQNSSEVITTVSDDGPGLPADRLREVRDRGVRLDESVSGSGLGLAIANDLAALYGGSVELFSPGPDGGLAADLTLPAARSRGARPAAEGGKNDRS